MHHISTRAELRPAIREARRAGKSIGLVPTMGALHAGHVRLVEEARRENDLVVMSLFVNPTQFGPAEDFERYPRDPDHDSQVAEEAGVNILFAPLPQEMYPRGPSAQRIWVDPGRMANHLCGASRPGHFRGVLTVVARFFHLVDPDRAYFGAKDGQQAALVAAMVDDLSMQVEIRVVPTVRDPDGLALSSRNVLLTCEERTQAPAIWRSLRAAREAIDVGERNAQTLESLVRWTVESGAPGARVDYVTVADLDTLQPVVGPIQSSVLVAVAAYFGQTRLIDNMTVRLTTGSPQFQ